MGKFGPKLRALTAVVRLMLAVTSVVLAVPSGVWPKPRADRILRRRSVSVTFFGRWCDMDHEGGPSSQLTDWSVYVLLIAAGIVALILLHGGHVTGEAGGSVVLTQVVCSLKDLKKR